MKIIVAPDSFKGSLSAMQAAQAMAEGIKQADSQIETILLPAADGGEGTMNALIGATDGRLVTHQVEDPLGRKISASYGVLGDGNTCVIEIAEASGLTRLSEEERNPLIASSFGTGQLIGHALDAGFRKFVMGLGGSATNDGGAGMLQALGMRFLDTAGRQLVHGGELLRELVRIEDAHFDPRIAESVFVIAGDVENPLIGENGASFVFGPQKGATPKTVQQLDRQLTNFANIVEEQTGMALHHKKGAGAAGGAGGALLAFFAGNMRRGIDVVLDAIKFESYLETADAVITGEGRSDRQTLSGKTPFGIAQAATSAGKPVILISGMIEEECKNLLRPYFTSVSSLVGDGVTVEQAITGAYDQLKRKTFTVVEGYIKDK